MIAKLNKAFIDGQLFNDPHIYCEFTKAHKQPYEEIVLGNRSVITVSAPQQNLLIPPEPT